MARVVRWMWMRLPGAFGRGIESSIGVCVDVDVEAVVVVGEEVRSWFGAALVVAMVGFLVWDLRVGGGRGICFRYFCCSFRVQ